MNIETEEDLLNFLSFGEQQAMKRALIKERKKLEASQKETKVIEKKKPKEPNLQWFPLTKTDLKPYSYIDWQDPSFNTHSSEISNRMKDNRMTMIVLPTGTGKTAITIATLGYLQKQFNEQIPFIVVTMSKSVQGQGWHNTIASYNLANPENELEPILIISYDIFTRAINHPKTRDKLVKRLGAKGMIVIDEVHNFKSMTSKRSKALQKLAHLKRISMTATPLTNNPVMDCASYLVMNGDYKNQTDFMAKSRLKEHIVQPHNKLAIYYDNGTVNTSRWPYYFEMIAKLNKVIYQPEIDISTLEMPDVKAHLISLPVDAQLVSDMRSLVKSYHLRQFDSFVDFLISASERIAKDEGKIEKLKEIVTNEKTKQPLIFYQNKVVLDVLIEELEKIGVRDYQIISGGMDFNTIDHSVNTPILIQYQAGAAAIEFKQSNTSIFYQNQYSNLNLIQARGRNCRRGMRDTFERVDHYYFISSVPFDRAIYQRVAKGESLSHEILKEIVENDTFAD